MIPDQLIIIIFLNFPVNHSFSRDQEEESKREIKENLYLWIMIDSETK